MHRESVTRVAPEQANKCAHESGIGHGDCARTSSTLTEVLQSFLRPAVDPRGGILVAQAFESRFRFRRLTAPQQRVGLPEFLLTDREGSSHDASGLLSRNPERHFAQN